VQLHWSNGGFNSNGLLINVCREWPIAMGVSDNFLCEVFKKYNPLRMQNRRRSGQYKYHLRITDALVVCLASFAPG